MIYNQLLLKNKPKLYYFALKPTKQK